ncbi:thioesterase family protein [Georgenia yuyongxinii]|uniref:Thioesterase family protein n=1 Tax=Georgenia yuyongxinii TaxID=2589797 RepID=A0A5B8C614_9MICO|nr:thioesterase family protein [Georgenia yuyongxinii]QDC25550.1 thioesterase family protein [Georgenia yuyongxinii]
MAYFERVGASAFRATGHVGGAWRTDEQHIAPALGLLAHAVELDRDARRDDSLVVGRLSYDILGTIPIDVVETSVRVVRPGRTVELVEATLGHDGRDAVLLRAWLMRPGDTTRVHATPLPRITPPADMPVWDASTVWPGGFVASAEVRREQVEPGRAAFWVRTPLPLVHGEEVSRLASAAGLFDIANGMTVRVDPRDVAFPNVDLTAHLFTQPRGDWLGFDTTVSFGPSGLGLTSSVIHDSGGPIGTIAQILTVRP